MIKIIIICLLSFSIARAVTELCNNEDRYFHICTDESQPVCAIQKNNKRITFENKCQACQAEDSFFIAKGKCESFPEEVVFCQPKTNFLKIDCPDIYQPVCGRMFTTQQFMCDSLYCTNTFDNGCFACSYSAVSYYLLGTCAEQKFEPNIHN